MAQGVAYKCKLKGLVNTNSNQDITLAASDNSYYAGVWVGGWWRPRVGVKIEICLDEQSIWRTHMSTVIRRSLPITVSII